MNARNVLEHLSNIAYGDEMAMLEAYQEYFKGRGPTVDGVKLCEYCRVPCAKILQCNGCYMYCCQRSFCATSKKTSHTCEKAGYYCHVCAKCYISECDESICNSCSIKCIKCSKRCCTDHVFVDKDTDRSGICFTCFDKFKRKKRKPDDDK